MPYNNTPIAPTNEATGSVSLPLARVKKIIATDSDIASCSNNAAFVMTVATEMFLQHLVEQSYNIVKSERKPRRNIQYRDVANAVARVENLEFLSDVVPKTQKMGSVKSRVGAAGGAGAGVGEMKGQRTLDGRVVGRDADVDEGVEEDGDGDDDDEAQAVNGARDEDDNDNDKMDVDVNNDGDEADEDTSMHTANESPGSGSAAALPIEKLVSP